MKTKWLLIIVFLFPFYSFGQQKTIKQVQPVQLINLKSIHLRIKQLHPVARKAIQSGRKPGKFKNVKVVYQPNVVLLKKDVRNKLVNKIGKNPILKVKDLRTLNIQKNKIYIDPESDLVFKPIRLSKDTIALTQPPIEKVFKDIKIPLQRVPINIANTDYTAKNTEVKEETDNSEYTMRLQFNDTLYHLSKEIKKGNSTTKINIDIKLDGFIGFTNPYVEAMYSKNDGYVLIFHAKEKAQLKATTDAKIEEKISFPIWGYDIPIENFGSCKIGIFLVIEANGEIHLEAGLTQGIQVDAGIKGKTLYYYPRSVKPVVNVQKSFDVNYKVEGKIKAFAGVDVLANIKYKSYEMLKLRTRAGVEMKAEVKNSDISNFTAEVGARFLIDGKLDIKAYKKDFELYNKYYKIWERQVKNTGGYIMTINDADAYYDRVWGTVYKKQKSDSVAFNGNIKLKVVHPNGQKTIYNGKTDKNGIFALTNVNLKKGDIVKIKAGDSPSWSNAFKAHIPFDEVHISYADYYTNTVYGSVSGTVSYFPKTNSQSNSSVQIPHSNIPKNTGIVTNKINFNVAKPVIKISKQMFDNAITYKGDVEITTEPLYHQAKQNLNSIQMNKKRKRYKRKKKFVKIDKKIPAINLTKTQKKKVVNLPFGMFRITNVDIKPGEKVKAKINIDGFVLESDFVVSDGLIVTPSIDVKKQGGIKSLTIQADDSYVVINAFRSKKSPTGKVHLIKGIDMKHTSPHRDFPNQKVDIPKLREFKLAVHPLVYYNKTLDLKPMSDKPGFSIAHTGAWQVKNIYYNRKYLVSFVPLDGHRFEFIGYTFEGRWAGYKFYEKTCKMEKYKWLQNAKPSQNNIQNNPVNPGKYNGMIGH